MYNAAEIILFPICREVNYHTKSKIAFVLKISIIVVGNEDFSCCILLLL